MRRLLYWVARVYVFVGVLTFVMPTPSPSILHSVIEFLANGFPLPALGIAIIFLILTSPPLNGKIKVLKWVLGISSAIVACYIYAVNVMVSSSGGGLGAIVFIYPLLLGAVVIFCEIIGLLIAEYKALHGMDRDKDKNVKSVFSENQL